MVQTLQKNISDKNHQFLSNIKPNFNEIQLNRFITGQSDKKTQRFYIWTVFLSLVGISLVAIILFPTKFTFWENTISDQGSISQNPIGSIIWRIGVIFNGIAHIPHHFYISRHLKPFHKKKANSLKIFGIISAIGFSLVGLISSDYGIIHYIAALVAFIGYFITATISFSILNRDLKDFDGINNKNRKKKIQLFSVYFSIYFIISGTFCLGSFLINKIFFNKGISPILEWNYLIAICFWLLFWPRVVKLLEN